MSELGRLERVELRNIWISEARDFTPWLAEDENLRVLGETVGLDLELEAVEQTVGAFRADILCKDALSDSWVLIENQLERTDHTHLGQLITYAAGLDAVTIMWIAARIAEEHRAAIDWLNEITDRDVRFFALEVELWKISGSPAAPKFNVVCKPNDWTRSATVAKKGIEDGSLSGGRQIYLEYWTAFEAILANHSNRIHTVKPLAQNWLVHSLGRTNVTLNGSWNRRENWVRAEIYLTGKSAQSFFEQLESERGSIEAELDQTLIWYDDAASVRRIFLERSFPDVSNPSSWTEQHEWLAEAMDRLHRVFAHRARYLTSAVDVVAK